MGIQINSNLSSLRADRSISSARNKVDKSLNRLASGKRVNRASDDAAGLAIALQMLSEADTSVVAQRNISDAVSVTDIADGALQTTTQITDRMNELAVQSSNGVLSDQQRTGLSNEFNALRSELDRISQTTQFNGQQLLQNDATFDIQAGTDGSANSQVSVDLPSVSASNLGLSTLDISTEAGARAAIEPIKTASATIATSRGGIGAAQSRLSTAFENLAVTRENSAAAASSILDADIATESANLARNKILLQGAVAVKAQANVQPRLALQLLK